ncbi:Uncharacterized membrane protein, DUF485 family [Melghirimyces thermohalophilus]|uniref:Uncharacterized membrane protein, DUF485 family n=2 Tax=Melghirimyces thermohalophilus TaxID=1236220 RepID=A0A1G6N249_9BACL|nr:Uncharacterized membrane protein, DUF485 family [Melghirimyces thermohalophilus]
MHLDREARTLFHSETFSHLMRMKKRFIIPCLTLLVLFYFCLPLSLWFYPGPMSRLAPVIGMPWGWLYAFSQFAMTWVLGWRYWNKAKQFDQLVRQMKVKG